MEENKPSTTGPLIYLSVDGRLEAAVPAVGQPGGQVLQPKHPIGPHGFRALILDSEGNRIALHPTVERGSKGWAAATQQPDEK